MKLPTTPFRFLFHFMRRQWAKFTLMVLASIIWAMNDAFFPYLLKQIINTVAAYAGHPDDLYGAVAMPLVLLASFWLIMEIFMRSRDMVEIYTLPRFRAQIRQAVFDYTQSHSHRYFSSQFTGNLAKKLSDLPIYSEYLVNLVCQDFVTAAMGAVIVFALLWLTQPIFAVILIAWLSLHLGITFLFFYRGKPLWETHAEAVSALSGKVVDVFANIVNVRLFARARYESSYLQRFQADEVVKAKRAMWRLSFMHIGLGLNTCLLQFGMLAALLYGWRHHWVSIGDFTQVLMQSSWLIGWAWYVTFRLNEFAKDYGTVDNALSLVRQPHELVDQPHARPLVINWGEIRFERVSFGYQKNKPVFRELSICIPASQKVGLVGLSGSGKSTFVNLILRFYDPQSGRILIDHQTIADVTQDSLHAQIAMIPQDPVLFHRSLLENIRYGRLEASDSEVMQAAKRAHCHEFIEQLPEGYQTLVGERGVKLSGGQRQRIAIARAILKNAPVLILDEATSALDSVTEKQIQESLRQLMHDRTTLVIAHRLSTLSEMDRLLVFHEGRIVEEGGKESLLEANGHFARLWAQQANGFLPDSQCAKQDIFRQHRRA